MPRRPLIRTPYYPYHVTTRTNNKEWFRLELDQVWKISKECLKIASTKYPVEIISFVLMQNHYHLLVQTPQSNLDQFMYEFNRHLSMKIRAKTDRINTVFGSRYKWCLINNQKYLANCYRYIYQNPLRAGLAHECENYPYSTLHYLFHNKSFPIPLFDKFGFKDHFSLSWINQTIEKSETRAIQSSFKKATLDVLKDPITRIKISLTRC